MFSIYGEDIGRVFDFRSPSIGTHEAIHDWPDDCYVSAGTSRRGRRGDGSGRTLFIEVTPPEGTFLRGEGATPQDCEDAAWEAYQRFLCCPSGSGHEWVPRMVTRDGRVGGRYTNGAGFCSHCGSFLTGVFTGKDLGQFCRTCGVPSLSKSDDGNFYCAQHMLWPEHLQPPTGSVTREQEGRLPR